MALPSGITTCSLTFGQDYSILGDDLSLVVRVTPSQDLIWAATGQRIAGFPVSMEATAGDAAAILLPHVDQAGFVDDAGHAVTNWFYTVVIEYTLGSSRRSVTKVVAPLAGQSSLDFDMVPSGTASTPVTVVNPGVISVNGQTGAVVVEGGGGDVASVNGQTGEVTITLENIGADPAGAADAALAAAKTYADAYKGSAAGTANRPLAATDASVTNARTPLAHKASHATGGSDAMAPSDIGAVPTTRKVNGKALSADVTLSAADIGMIALAQAAPGTSFEVSTSDGTNWKYAGTVVTSRPTSRTDLRMYAFNYANSSPCPFAIDDDKLFLGG